VPAGVLAVLLEFVGATFACLSPSPEQAAKLRSKTVVKASRTTFNMRFFLLYDGSVQPIRVVELAT
jgi:hypothetical protein